MSLKDQKLAGIISELAAEFLSRESNRTSLITVTRSEALNRGKKAIVYFTVLPEVEENAALEFARRKRGEFRKLLTDKKVVGFAPLIDFQIDLGEKNRQRIDQLSNEDVSK
jgi:ribosome-binding factor A